MSSGLKLVSLSSLEYKHLILETYLSDLLSLNLESRMIPSILSTEAVFLLTELAILPLLASSKLCMHTGRHIGVAWAQVTVEPVTKPAT